MTSNSEIRLAGTRDLAGISAVIEATELFPTDLLAEMIDGYLTGETDDIWYVSETEGAITAFGFCEPERMTEGTWNLLALGVMPSHQGTGIGGAMMGYIEDMLRKDGQRVLLVETMSIPEFEPVQRFYLKCGYTEEARIREFYEAGADKIVYWKHL